MAIMNLKKGDKVRLTNHAANIIGRRDLLGKELVVSEMFHDKDEAEEHVKDGCGTDNLYTCSCCNYARIDGIDFNFWIEDGEGELERI
jgi:hypothetical protein